MRHACTECLILHCGDRDGRSGRTIRDGCGSFSVSWSGGLVVEVSGGVVAVVFLLEVVGTVGVEVAVDGDGA